MNTLYRSLSAKLGTFAGACFSLMCLGLTNVAAYTVIVDPGHGGRAAGAAWPGVVEKQLTLDTSQRLVNELRRRGIAYVITRNGDYDVSLSRRAAIANAYPGGIFVSVHFNSATNQTATGLETYYYHASGRALATAVQSQMIRETRGVNRGVKRRGYAVLSKNRTRAAILVEGGFLSNPSERRRCLSPHYRQGLARAIANGIEQTYGRRRPAYTPPAANWAVNHRQPREQALWVEPRIAFQPQPAYRNPRHPYRTPNWSNQAVIAFEPAYVQPNYRPAPTYICPTTPQPYRPRKIKRLGGPRRR